MRCGPRAQAVQDGPGRRGSHVQQGGRQREHAREVQELASAGACPEVPRGAVLAEGALREQHREEPAEAERDACVQEAGQRARDHDGEAAPLFSFALCFLLYIYIYIYIYIIDIDRYHIHIYIIYIVYIYIYIYIYTDRHMYMF